MPDTMTKPVTDFRQSKLFVDFVQNKPAIKKYFPYDDPRVVAQNLGAPKIDRDFLCDILVKQNESFGSKPETFRNIERLRDEETVTIFGGQQSGLFTGPLYTLYKAIGIVKKAVMLQAEIGRPVVPVFWIACDDHDFEEINHTYFPNRSGELDRVAYEPEGEFNVAVADICMEDGDAYDKMVEQTKASLGSSDFTDDLYTRLFEAYKKDDGMVKAFARFMADVLPDMGLIFFCPNNKDVKTISKSFFKRLVEGHFKLKEVLKKTERNLKEDGYHIQAEKKNSAVHLFFHDPKRTPIHFEGEDFMVGEKRLGLPAMIDMIDKYPERFSPDVLTRPIWQSYLFPVVAQSGGPSEIAYFGQIGNLFELFKLVQPHIVFRPTVTLVEKRHEELLEEYNIGIVDLAGDVEQLINQIVGESFPEDIKDKLDSFKSDLKIEYDELAGLIGEHFKNLAPMAEQTYGKIADSLDRLEKKIMAEHKKENDVTRNRIYKLHAALFPANDFQERSLNICYFISKYGFELAEFVADKLDAKSSDHQIIYLSEFTG